MNNGYNFTERVRKVLAMAREEAARLHHEYVGTEHILLGVIREGEGVAATVLQNLSVELDEVQQEIEAQVKKGKATQASGPDLPYTSRAKKVLELAMAEARELNHSCVGTEHLLLGLLREEKGLAGQVLIQAGVTHELARAETVRILGTPPDEQRRADVLRTSAATRPSRGVRSLDRLAHHAGISISPRVSALMSAAHQEAVDRTQPGIGIDHVVLAMFRSGEGTGLAILENLGVDIGAVRDQLASAAPRGDHHMTPEAWLAYLPAVQSLMQLATEEAQLDGAPEIGTEHILIAALREKSSPAIALISAAGVTLERARAEARRISG